MHVKRRLARIAILVGCELVVAALGWWQYRSIDALSRTETQVLKSAMRERAAAFIEDYEGQMLNLISALTPGAIGDPAISAADLAASLDSWRNRGAPEELLREVWCGRDAPDQAPTSPPVRRWLKLEGPRWVPEVAPPYVGELCKSLGIEPESPLRLASAAIVLPMISQPPGRGDGRPGCIVALLDGNRLRGPMVESLIARHITGGEGDRYFYVVRDLSAGTTIAGGLRGEAEVRLPFLFSKQDVLGPAVPLPVVPPSKRATVIPLVAPAANQPNWELLVGLVGGSVEQHVTATRRLNLGVTWMLSAALGIAMIGILKSQERSEQLQAQQSQFVAAVSHELRTPLAAIRTLAQNQADGMISDPGRAREYGRLLMGEAERLHATFEHCLAFAGVQSKAAVPAARVDASEAAQAVCARFGAAHPEMRITVRGERDAWVSCSRDLLEQALYNLLDNARKFARPGAGVVEVSVALQASELVIMVQDEGIGVPPDEISQLGTPFFRGRYARDGQIAGLGLGLSLVRSFAERYGGRMRMERREAGLAVILILPAR